MKIRSYLALMVAAIMVPVMVFSAIALDLMLKAEREAALQRVRDTARIALVSIDRELANTQSALRMLAVSTHLSKSEFAEFYDKARYADQLGATVTALLDENGQLVLTTSLPYGAPLPPATAGERVARVLESGQPQISNLVRSAVSQRTLVVVDVPVTTRAGKRYVLSQGYDIAYFNRVLRQVNVPTSWLAGVYDRNGLTIARTEGEGDHSRDAGAIKPVLRNAIRDKTVGVIRNDSDSGVKLYTVLERSAMSGWTVAVGVPEAEIEAVARRALMFSLLGLFAAVACAGGAAWLFARRISMSIRAAARSALALEQGLQPGPAIASGVTEVDAVQAAIVSAGAVINREQAQRQAAEDERARLFASEHAARTMAEQQNRAKDEFLAMLGHELRNPLAAIVNATHVLGHQATTGASATRASDIIARQSGHLTRIVDDLLDVGRVHSGKILLARRPVRLDALAVAYAAHIASGRGAAHQISAPPSTAPVWIDADPTRIEQILANLVDNAIKYTPAGGAISITVDASPDGADAVLTVADSGMGIDAALMPNVFELFVQGATALDRAQGGMGVGLALVRQLAVMHGGRVSVQSAGAGQGSRFELRLPRIAAPVENVAAADPAHAPALAQTAGGAVLLIEDNDDGRDMMAMMLQSQGYTVHAAANGPAGLALAAAELPAIALIDIGLPGIDGYEVARRLRADPATTGMRLVALTGYGQDSDRTRALAAGFDNHLVKPVDLTLLLAELETVSVASH